MINNAIRISRWPELATTLAVVVLGALVMLGWILDIAPLVQLRGGFIAMVFNTAACFGLLGIALLSSNRGARRAITLFVIAFSGLIFAQYVFGTDFGVDRLFDATRFNPGISYPGRMAPQTALCFMAAGSAVLLLEQPSSRARHTLAQVLILLVGVAGLLSLVGYSIRLELLYSWHRYTRMAVHTALGFTLVAIALWMRWYRVAEENGEFVKREERQLNAMGTALILLVGTGAGCGGFIALADRAETLSFQALSTVLHEQSRSLQHVIGERKANAHQVAWHLAALLRADDDDSDYLHTAPGGISGVEIRNLEGVVLTSSGHLRTQPGLILPLADGTMLLYDGAPYLRFHVPLSGTGVATVDTRFDLITELIGRSAEHGRTADLRVCASVDLRLIQCLPSRLVPQLEVAFPRIKDDKLTPMDEALEGSVGAQTLATAARTHAIAAHAPVAGTSLGLVLQVDAEETYAPIRTTLQKLLLLLCMLMGVAVWILRKFISPLLREAIRSRAQASANATRVAAIMDNVPDGIITIDRTGSIVSLNPAVSRMFGHAEDALLGANIKILMPESERAAHDSGFVRHRASGARKLIGAGPVEVPAQRADGSIFPMELTIDTMKLNGEHFYVGIMHDITRRREVDRMKSEFVAVVSHELRTPLTSIHASIGLIHGGAAGKLPPKAEQLIKLAWRNTDRLTALVNDILDLEKMVAGHLTFDIGPHGLRASLTQALEINAGFAASKQVDLELDPKIPVIDIDIDLQRTMQVLSNLLTNAIKFSAPGTAVRISAGVERGLCRISVTDRGPGIPPAFQPHIFERFSQADGSDRRASGGTGLGLAISKGLIERMGGRIGFSSEAGCTTFWIEVDEVDSHGERASA